MVGFFGGASPHYGDFFVYHFADLMCTLDGGATLDAQTPPIVAWYKAMAALPSIAAYRAARAQPGDGSVGRPGSLMFKYTDVASRR